MAYNCKCERARKSSQDGQKINAIWIVDHSMFKLTLPMQVARPILTNNSIEQHCFVVMNVKLLVRIGLKTFSSLLELLYTAFALNKTTNTACFARNFRIS